MEQSKTLLDLSSEIRQLREEKEKLLTVIEETRRWYVEEGFTLLAPDTPIVFSKLLTTLLRHGRGKDLI